jgi:hypothetical protein
MATGARLLAMSEGGRAAIIAVLHLWWCCRACIVDAAARARASKTTGCRQEETLFVAATRRALKAWTNGGARA